MHLIVCIDERDGLSFCGHRLSQDRLLNQRILQLADRGKLWMNAYSARLFPPGAVVVDEDFLQKAGPGDYCFLETTPLGEAYENLESVILCHWNRSYPSTVKFHRKLLESMHFAAAEAFPGSSHDKITMERFVR